MGPEHGAREAFSDDDGGIAKSVEDEKTKFFVAKITWKKTKRRLVMWSLHAVYCVFPHCERSRTKANVKGCLTNGLQSSASQLDS